MHLDVELSEGVYLDLGWRAEQHGVRRDLFGGG